MELSILFLSEIYIQRGHPYLSVFLLSSRRPKERRDSIKKEDNASGGIKIMINMQKIFNYERFS